MSKASISSKPAVDNPRSYPWGENTGTYKLWLTLITINIIALSVVFLVDVEIPYLVEVSNQNGLGQSESLLVGNSTTGVASSSGGFESPLAEAIPVNNLVEYGKWVIVANVVLVWVLKTVGKWLTTVEKWCRDMCKCKWYKPWCCLGRLFCWFVTVVKWVTYVIAVASSVITSVLVWVSANAGNVQG